MAANVSFRVAARTLLHLGAELISSDIVALSELVKNAFDARSPRATIDVDVRIPFDTWSILSERVHQGCVGTARQRSRSEFEVARTAVIGSINLEAPDAKRLREEVARSDNWQALSEALIAANAMVVSDTGEGMSLDTLNSVYLTIGTRSRRSTKQTQDSEARRILGEKGVGRLAVMRLGSRLRVESTTAGESHWNVLEIDWSAFSHDSDALVDSISVVAVRGSKKSTPLESGTRISITGLHAEWDRRKLEDLAKREFSKLSDPFTTAALFPIQLRFNGDPVPIPRFNALLLSNAHATVAARYEAATDGHMRLAGVVRYKGREQAFALEGTHLTAETHASVRVLASLGPFDAEIYWYNRRELEEVEGIGDRKAVKQLVADWGGGLMVFRDGYRVMPYGDADDDWLDLDRKALASGGYKVNRAQLIGRVSITSRGNAALTDQTNREGLRDSPEKDALVHILRFLLINELRAFLNEVDEEVLRREPIDVRDAEARVVKAEEKIEGSLRTLIERVPEVRKERALVQETTAAAKQLRDLVTRIREEIDAYQAGREQLLHLAGIGLIVESLAHELHRAIDHTLRTLAELPASELTSTSSALVRTLTAQLKTLQKRLSVLDPLSTSGRQRKESFDVIDLVRDTLESHREEFAREHITCTLSVVPDRLKPRFVIKAVKGMIVQVLENLIANSVFWLRQQRIVHPNHNATIHVTIDMDAKEMSVTDNGPGVPESAGNRVFEAFYSTKPAGQGKGLGLFIAREIAQYHGADLFLDGERSGPEHTQHTFVLTLAKVKQ
jgi:signal transduction histidine kinase